MTEERRPLRVGILVDAFHQPAWITRILEDIRSSDIARTVLVVENVVDASPPASPLDRVRERPDLALYWLYQVVDQHVFGLREAGKKPRLDAKIATQRVDPFAVMDIGPLVIGADHIKVQPRRTKFSDYFSHADLEAVRSYDLDVLLRFGFRILRGEVLEVPRFGVWSYHHGDNEKNRGGPAGFWEVFERAPVTGSLLQRLTEDLDNGVVLCRAYSSTDKYSVVRNRSHYFLTSSAFVIRTLRLVSEHGPESVPSPDASPAFRPYSNRLYMRPKNTEMAGLLLRHGASIARERLQHALTPEQWILAYRVSYGVPTLYRFKHLVPPPSHSWADPFPLVRDGQHYVFFEEDDPARGRARISVMKLGPGGDWCDPEPALDPGHHVSYPFVFEWRGQLYMVPETLSARCVSLYRCTDFPSGWELEAVLLEDVSAVDATLAEVDDVWWMFVNIAVDGSVDYSELHLYWATTPTGPWRPHRHNPVKSDARSSRPAGKLFWWKGDLLRPAQDCGQRYGFATTIQRVRALDRQSFVEEEVGRIEPTWDRNLLATHTFNMVPGLTVVDALRRRPRFGRTPPHEGSRRRLG